MLLIETDLQSTSGDCKSNPNVQALVCLLDSLSLPTTTLTIGVGRTFESVYLSVCLFVRSITQNRMIPKCSNLVAYREWPWDYPISDTVLGLNSFDLSRLRLGLGLWQTAIRRWFELCLIAFLLLDDFDEVVITHCSIKLFQHYVHYLLTQDRAAFISFCCPRRELKTLLHMPGTSVIPPWCRSGDTSIRSELNSNGRVTAGTVHAYQTHMLNDCFFLPEC